ncbi:MAG: fibronectin type III domain-containing protein [Bacteroidota bacterium]|nr:fibronectin type III domain-containing protein [Bacteroidota bacterium]
MNRLVTYFLLPAWLISGSFTGKAQDQADRNQLPLFNSANGPVILFGGSSIKASGKDAKGVQYALFRSEVNGGAQKQIALPGMVASLAAFKKAVGASVIAQLEQQLKLGSETALWSYLQQHPDLSSYGLASFNIPFRAAMGAAYIDEEVRTLKGRTYLYTIGITMPGQAATNARSTITIGQAPDFARPQLTLSGARDSMVTLQWKMVAHRDIPYLATVFRQTGGRGDFVRLSSRILAKQRGDTISFRFSEKVYGHSAYRYFIRPADLLDNAGTLNSDTAAVVAANFHKLPLLTDLKARDTLNAILLSWRTLPIDPLITGIEIWRSRDVRGDFVVLDTVSPLSHAYTDRRLVPHVAYYYRLCVLHAGRQEQNDRFFATVSASQQKTSRVPDAPYGLSAQTTARGVRVAWQPIDDPDLYAYYVYRGTSLNSKCQVISPALTDTVFTDTASNLSSATAYVYAVKAVTTSSKESPFSGKVSAHLPKGKERPLTPGGIRLSPRPGALYIEWDDTKKNDPAILGYLLYKRKVAKTPLQYDGGKPASYEATRLGLSLAVNGLITVPYFEDSLPRYGEKVDYLVSAVDQFGTESGLSPVASSARLGNLERKPPSRVLARTTAGGITLQWEQADMAGIEGFVIYRRTVREHASRKIARVPGGITQFTDKQTAQGNLYVYTITALTDAGETSPSEERTVRK